MKFKEKKSANQIKIFNDDSQGAGDTKILDLDRIEASLERRVTDIRNTVNELIRTLHGVKHFKEYFRDVETLVKLRYLLEMEADLDETKVIRMNDTVQSFDILESPGYYKVKSVEELIANFPEKSLKDYLAPDDSDDEK